MRASSWAGLAGIVFAVLFVIGMIAPSLPVGGGASPDEVIREFYLDDANLSRVVISIYVLGASGLAFIVFLAGLHRRLSAADGPEQLLSNVVLIAGVTWVAMLFGGSAGMGALAGGMWLGGEPQELTDTSVARFVAHFGYSLVLLFGGLAAALMVLAASALGQRTRALPSWLNWAGYLAAVLLLGGIIFLPMLALPLWVLAASVVLLRAPTLRATD